MRQQQHVRYVRWFDEIGLDDVNLVGGKNASLGELAEALGDRIKVPEGFAITIEGYRRVVDLRGLWQNMMRILDGTNWADPKVTGTASRKLRKLILGAPLPDGLATEIEVAYRRLERKFGRGVAVAVRSSATAEDSPKCSMAFPSDQMTSPN